MSVANNTNSEQQVMPPYQDHPQIVAVQDAMNAPTKDHFQDANNRQIQPSHIGSSLGQSVVPDLMRVYESLTQSSTPHSNPSANANRNRNRNTGSDPHYSSQKTYNAAQSQQPPQHIHHQYQHNTQQASSNISHDSRYHQRPDQHNTQHQHQNNVQPHQELNSNEPFNNPPVLHQHGNLYTHSTQRSQEQDTAFNRVIQPPQNYHETKKPILNSMHVANHVMSPSQNMYSSQPIHNPNPSNYTDSSDVDSKLSSRKRAIENDNTITGNDGNVPASKSRKKMAGDSRWSKRFTWPDALHRDFVSAIFDVGLKHASPSAILEHMTPNAKITSERIKSHLQKYRLHKAKSKREFMESYDLALNKFKRNGLNESDPTSDMSNQRLSLGEVAAHLSFTEISLDVSGISPTPALPEEHIPPKHPNVTTHQAGLRLPQLTEEEKRSPLGASMGYLLGLFVSLTQQISMQRASKYGVNTRRNSAHENFPAQGHPPQQNMAIHNTGKQQHPQKEVVYNGVPSTHSEPCPILHNDPKSIPPKNFKDWTPPQTDINVSHHQKHPPQHGFPDLQNQQWSTPATTTVAKDNSEVSPPTRTFPNVEESNKMKREMLNQMALQKNFRLFKQQELNKCTNQSQSVKDAKSNSINHTPATIGNTSRSQPTDGNDKGTTEQGSVNVAKNDAEHAGDENSKKTNTIWEGTAHGVDNFWNVDMMDDQLFEFLWKD